VIVSAMVESKPEALARHHQAKFRTRGPTDRTELRLPALNERNRGDGQRSRPGAEYGERITGWVRQVARIPVIVNLTPNISNIVMPAARGRGRAGADALSLINTINSIIGWTWIRFKSVPTSAARATRGYAGPAVKPVALNMAFGAGTDEIVSESNLPISRDGRNLDLVRCSGISAAGRQQLAGCARQ